MDSHNIVESLDVQNSSSVIYSKHILNSTHLNKCENVKFSSFCTNCANLNHSLFCSNLKNDNYVYYLFNHQISAEEYQSALRIINRIGIDDLFFTTFPIDFLESPNVNMDLNFAHYYNLSTRAKKAIETLPYYDSFVMYQITFNSDFLQF